MKKYILLLYFRIKSAFLSLPGILAAACVFALTAGLIGFAGTKLLYDENTVKPVDIALVLPTDSEAYTLAAFTFLSEIDTVKSLCTFNEMSEDAAFTGLKNGSIDAVILIPDKFIEHIMNGTNTPAEIILPKSERTSSSPLFRELIRAGVGDLAIAQSGIYAVDDACRKYGLGNELAAAELYLNETYLSYSLNRSIYFNNKTVLSTGSLTLVQFYSCTAIVLLIMFSCVSCIHLLGRESKALNITFLRKRIPASFVSFSRTFGVSLMYFAITCFALLCCFLVSAFSENASDILKTVMPKFGPVHLILMFICIFTAVSIAQTILMISDNISASVTLLFLLTIVMMFLAGAFIPSVLLPKALQKIGLFMPVTWVLRLLGNILSGSFDIINIIANAIICCICTITQSLLVKINL